MRNLVVGSVLVGLLAGAASATVTKATVSIGGLGGFTSCGPQNPPTICDGVTIATAEVEFTYDDGVSPPRLTLVVSNTSPVVPGVGNPVITTIDFNTPVGGVSGLSLVSQSGSGGATPTWSLTFDADLASNPNPNSAGGMGTYNAQLDNPGGTAQGIANPLADTLCITTATTGPVTFEFDVTLAPGGSTLTAGSFATAFSVIPPGTHQANVTMHFQAGGPDCQSGHVTNSPDCKPGAFATGTTPPDGAGLGDTVCFTMSGAPGCEGCLGLSFKGNGPVVLSQPPFPDLVVPLSLPIFVVLGPALPNTTVSACLDIPSDPTLLGIVIYFAAVQVDQGTGEFFGSVGFSLTIVP